MEGLEWSNSGSFAQDRVNSMCTSDSWLTESNMPLEALVTAVGGDILAPSVSEAEACWWRNTRQIDLMSTHNLVLCFGSDISS